MQELTDIVSQCATLARLKTVMSKAGRLSDTARRELVASVAKSPIQDKDKKAAFSMVMPHLGEMLNGERCLEWWEAVMPWTAATLAALDHKLPFNKKVLGISERSYLIEEALGAKNPEVALILWTRASDNAGRKELLCSSKSNVALAIARINSSEDGKWRDSVSAIFRQMTSETRNALFGDFFCERCIYHGMEIAPMRQWVGACFPEGFSEKEGKSLEIEIEVRCIRSGLSVGAFVKECLLPGLSIHAANILSSNTTPANKPATARRI